MSSAPASKSLPDKAITTTPLTTTTTTTTTITTTTTTTTTAPTPLSTPTPNSNRKKRRKLGSDSDDERDSDYEEEKKSSSSSSSATTVAAKEEGVTCSRLTRGARREKMEEVDGGSDGSDGDGDGDPTDASDGDSRMENSDIQLCQLEFTSKKRSSTTKGCNTRRNTRSTTAAAAVRKAENAVNTSKRRQKRKQQVQEENDPDTPYRPSSSIAKAYPNDKSMQSPKKQKREHTNKASSANDERKESDRDEDHDMNGDTKKKSKKRSNMFQVCECDRDCLSLVYSYLTRIEFISVILVSRHWNRVGSMRSCWPPFARETTLQRYVISTVGEYDESVLHPRRVEPKGIFDLQRLTRAGGSWSQVNDLAFDEKYYANPSPLIELTKLKNLTSLKYTIEDITQLNLFQPFAEVMSHRLLVLTLFMNHHADDDARAYNWFEEARIKRHERYFAPIGLLTSLRVLVTNTLPPDSILVKLHSLELLHCPTDCHLHPYTARVIRYLSVRHQLRHVSFGGIFDPVDGYRGPNFQRCSTTFIANLCSRQWKDTLNMRDEREENKKEEEEKKNQNQQADSVHSPLPTAPFQSLHYPWYIDPIPPDDANVNLPIARLTSFLLGESRHRRYHHFDLCTRDFLSLFSMSTLRHLRCQVESQLSIFTKFAASEQSTSWAAKNLESLELEVNAQDDFTSLGSFVNLQQLRMKLLSDTWGSMRGFPEMVTHLGAMPQLKEVHWYERPGWGDSIMVSPNLIPALLTSSTWSQLHYHRISDDSKSHWLHPRFSGGEPAGELLTPDVTSNVRIQQFRLYVHETKGRERLQSICRISTNQYVANQRHYGWVRDIVHHQ